MDDLYHILGVEALAETAEIKKAYRSLAKQYHPDHNKDQNAQDLDHWHHIQEAYDTLTHEQKRLEYDQQRARQNKPKFAQSIFSDINFEHDKASRQTRSPFANPFAGFQAQTRQSYQPRAGEDVETEVIIPVHKAFVGGKLTLAGTRYEICETCHGEGVARPPRHTCPDCEGTGHTNIGVGKFATCRRCSGTGEITTEPCRACDMSGYVKRNHRWTVNIMPGIREGSILRLPRKGKPGAGGGPPGDLLIHVRISQDTPFKRDGQDLEITFTVDPVIALMGGSGQVKVPEGGEIQIRIPKNTVPGKRLRIKGRGMPLPSQEESKRGDLYARIQYAWSPNMTSEQKKLLTQYLKSL